MEGANLRRDFDLPEEDTEFLDATNFLWETVIEGKVQWLIIHDFPVPRGYTVEKTDAAFQIPVNYPTTGLDMVYFYPALRRTDGVHIGAIEATVTIQGIVYQRWSRHRTSVNPWRPGFDNISAHLSLTEEWLLREFKKIS